jgi:predicted nucleic-acid-binding Zn-ribbon protein
MSDEPIQGVTDPVTTGQPLPESAQATESPPKDPDQDPDQEVRQAEANRIQALMLERWPDPPPCPFCHHDEYTISDVMVLYPRKGGPFAHKVYPVFQVICTTCGYTHLFNARVAGVDVASVELPSE